jgi:hypothetical protein
MKRKLKRVKVGDFWCSIYAAEVTPGIWTLGMVINRSKRASNDWFERRRNRRAKRVRNEKTLKGLRQLRGCWIVSLSLLKELPIEDHVFIINDFPKAQALSKFMERVGFTPVLEDGKLIWVLTAQKKREVLHRF